MVGNGGFNLTTWVLRIYLVILLFYGLFFLLFPAVYVSMSGIAPATDLAKVRWPGGCLIGLSYACLIASANPSKHVQLVRTVALAGTLAGLSLLYSHFSGEYTGLTTFIIGPGVTNLAAGALLWWGSSRRN